MPDAVVEEARPVRDVLGGETDDDRLLTPSLLEVSKEKDGDKKVVSRLHDLWLKQDRQNRLHMQEWRVNRARRLGISNVKLFKRDIDRADSYDVYAPPGVNLMPASLNKADRLCRRVNNFIFTDPPKPEAIPSRNDDQARDAAEVTTRVLEVHTSDGQIDDLRTMRRAADLACTYDSGFRHHFVDPRGGGSEPIELFAHPMAESITEALPVPIDPDTGAEYDGPYVTKFVRMDGSLTDDPNDTDLRRRFFPKLRTEVLTGKNVRMLPATAMDISEADGVLIVSYQPLSLLRSMYEGIDDLTDEELRTRLGGEPLEFRQVLTRRERQIVESADWGDPDRPVFTMICYRKQSAIEKRGVFCVALGCDYLAHIQDWSNPHTGSALDIPVDQFRQFESEESVYGRGLMRQLGGGNDLMGLAYEAFITHMERMKNRRVFLPTNSIIQPQQLQSPTATTIPMNPGGKPEYEEVPQIPAEYFQFLKTVGEQMDDESGLQQAGQAINAPSVKSALHARQIIEQVGVSLSDIKQNYEAAIRRGYRIYTQLIRAYFSVPMVVRYVGDDGAHKVERWSGSDFGDTEDIRIDKGSFTQLSPPAKAAEAERYFAMVDPTTGERLMSISELRQSILNNVGGLLQIQDSPARNRVRRQIKAWLKGPPPEFWEAWEARQKAQQLLQQLQIAAQRNPQAQQDPQFAAMVQQVQAVLQQPLPGPFDRNPHDEEIDPARIRHYELARTLASEKISGQPPEWISVLSEAYLAARRAAGVQTTAEIAQAQQQAQQAQHQSEMQLELAKIRAKAQAQLQIELLKLQAQGQDLSPAEIARLEAQLQQTLIEAEAQIETARINMESAILESEIDKEAVAIQAAANSSRREGRSNG